MINIWNRIALLLFVCTISIGFNKEVNANLVVTISQDTRYAPPPVMRMATAAKRRGSLVFPNARCIEN